MGALSVAGEEGAGRHIAGAAAELQAVLAKESQETLAGNMHALVQAKLQTWTDMIMQDSDSSKMPNIMSLAQEVSQALW